MTKPFKVITGFVWSCMEWSYMEFFILFYVPFNISVMFAHHYDKLHI